MNEQDFHYHVTRLETPNSDNTTPEIINALEEYGLIHVKMLLSTMHDTCDTPADLDMCFIAIPQKYVSTESVQHPPISIMSHIGKMLQRIAMQRKD